MRIIPVLLALLALITTPCMAQVLLTGFEDLSGWNVAGDAEFEQSADAREGAASIRVTMPGQVSGRVITGFPPEELDAYAGVSFWARGDGSDQWGCIALHGDGSNASYR